MVDEKKNLLSSNQIADQSDHQMADQIDAQMADQIDDQFDSQTLCEIGDPFGFDGLDQPDRPDRAQSQPVQLARLAGCKSCRPGTTLHCLLRACLASSSGSFGSSGVADALTSWVEAKKPLRLLLSPNMLAYSLKEQQQWTKSRICEPFAYSAGADFVAVTTPGRLLAVLAGAGSCAGCRSQLASCSAQNCQLGAQLLCPDRASGRPRLGQRSSPGKQVIQHQVPGQAVQRRLVRMQQHGNHHNRHARRSILIIIIFTTVI